MPTYDELLDALKAVLACETRHDERGHAYLAVPARSVFDLAASISCLVKAAEAERTAQR
jgi:hypothetical protein